MGQGKGRAKAASVTVTVTAMPALRALGALCSLVASRIVLLAIALLGVPGETDASSPEKGMTRGVRTEGAPQPCNLFPVDLRVSQTMKSCEPMRACAGDSC